jgi:hypothetical protein
MTVVVGVDAGDEEGVDDKLSPVPPLPQPASIRVIADKQVISRLVSFFFTFPPWFVEARFLRILGSRYKFGRFVLPGS